MRTVIPRNGLFIFSTDVTPLDLPGEDEMLNILTSFRPYVKKKRVSYFYRTATTSYLCYVPVLEDSEGAGRKRLTPDVKVGRIS